MQCDVVAEQLAEVAAGAVLLDGPARRHVETCLRCQAELAQYRRLFRSLRSLSDDVAEPSPGLLEDVLASIDALGDRRALAELVAGRRMAYLGGLAAAAGGAAIVFASRSRRWPRLAG